MWGHEPRGVRPPQHRRGTCSGCPPAVRPQPPSVCFCLRGLQASLSPRKGIQQRKCGHEGTRTTVIPGEQLHLEGGASLKGRVPKVVTGTWRTLPWALLVSDLPQGWQGLGPLTGLCALYPVPHHRCIYMGDRYGADVGTLIPVLVLGSARLGALPQDVHGSRGSNHPPPRAAFCLHTLPSLRMTGDVQKASWTVPHGGRPLYSLGELVGISQNG